MNIRTASAGVGVAIALAVPLIERVEGTEYKPYRDVAGVLTVCSGVTGPDVIPGKTYSKSECRALLAKHVKIHSNYVDKAVTWPISNYTRAALISFSYNVGGNGMKNSTAIRLINQGKLEQGCNALAAWNKITVKGKKVISKGLVNRRSEEIKQCLKGIDK